MRKRKKWLTCDDLAEVDLQTIALKDLRTVEQDSLSFTFVQLPDGLDCDGSDYDDDDLDDTD